MKDLIKVLGILVLLSIGSIFIFRKEISENLIISGSKYFNSKDHKTANLYYTFATFFDPKNLEPQYYKADSLSIMGFDKESESIFQNLLKKFSDDYKVNYFYGAHLSRINKYEIALEHFAKSAYFAYSMQDKDFVIISTKKISWCYEKLGDFKNAEHYLSILIDDGVQNGEIYLNRALMRMKQFKKKEALGDIVLAENYTDSDKDKINLYRSIIYDSLKKQRK